MSTAHANRAGITLSFERRLALLMVLLTCIGAFCTARPIRAQTPSGQDAKATTLAPVVVIGVPSGPALWKVSKGDHVLWIMGIAEPLPRKVKWQSEQVEKIIAQSQEVIGPVKGRSAFDIDPLQVVDILKARKLPDNQRLADVMPPSIYAKWLALKTQYVGQSDSIERRRPRFAAKELYEAAYDRLGLSLRDDVWNTVERLARRYKVPIKTSRITIVADNQVADQFKNAPIGVDMPCFERTLAVLDNNAGPVVERANAWSTGDMDVLRGEWVSPQMACAVVLTHIPAFAPYQTKLLQRTNSDWADAADAALTKNKISFGVQPMAALFQPDGALAILRSHGYTVEDPR